MPDLIVGHFIFRMNTESRGLGLLALLIYRQWKSFRGSASLIHEKFKLVDHIRMLINLAGLFSRIIFQIENLEVGISHQVQTDKFPVIRIDCLRVFNQ